MQIVWVGEQKNKADFKIKEKIRWKNDLICSCRKKHTEKKWYDEIGQSVFSFKMHNSLREAEKQSELERSSEEGLMLVWNLLSQVYSSQVLLTR